VRPASTWRPFRWRLSAPGFECQATQHVRRLPGEKTLNLQEQVQSKWGYELPSVDYIFSIRRPEWLSWKDPGPDRMSALDRIAPRLRHLRRFTRRQRVCVMPIKGLHLSSYIIETRTEKTAPRIKSRAGYLSAIPAYPPMGRRSRASLRSFAPLAALAGTSLQPHQRLRAMSPWGWLQQINRLPAAGGSTGSGR